MLTTKLRASLAMLCLVTSVMACGGDDITLTEYVDLINAAAQRAGDKAAELTAEGVLGGDVTPRQLEAGINRGLNEIRIPLQESVDAITPPEQVADLHDLLWTWHADFIAIETTLATRAGQTPDTEEGWTAFSNSAEVVAYRDSVAAGKQVCVDFQRELDDTAIRDEFKDVPWLPGELKEVVVAALGCQWFPDDPTTIYQYPPP